MARRVRRISRPRRLTVKRRASPRKTMPRRTRARRVYRRARSGVRRYAAGRGKIGSFFKRGVVGDSVSALGAGIVTQAAVGKVAPQASVYAGAAGGYLAGGVVGMIIAEGVKSYLGIPSILSNVSGLLGGGGSGNGGGGVV